MNGTIQESIVTQNGVKGIIGSKDLRKLFFDVGRDIDELMDPTPQTWKQKRKESFQIEQMQREIVNNILHDSNLSQSYGNPEWYPPVPKINPLYIHEEEGGADFIRNNISIRMTPLSVEEFDMECLSLISIDPSILQNTIIHEKDVDIITGNVVSQNFSYPIITRRIGYLVSLLSNGKSIELTSIYAYNNKNLLGNLIEFIKDLEVSNTGDLLRARRYIENAYAQLG